MTDTPPIVPPGERIGGGGAAASAGIRFQQQLGALFSSWILAGDRFDNSFRLGAAVPEWVRFETEAPVDDLLIKSTDDGYIAVQAKTSVSLSKDLDSPLGKTIAQFVRHWLAARQGDGSMGWNRPLHPSRDRLVLAVSPTASAQVRMDLPDALSLVSQPGGGTLNQAQKKAYRIFSSLVKTAWATVTNRTLDELLLSELTKLVTVFTFDSDQGAALASGSLVKAFGPEVNVTAAFTILSDLSGQLMEDRGGGDLSTWRRLLAGQGVLLGVPPEYRTDIEALKKHSKRITDALGRYEKIEVAGGAPLTVPRDCQTAVEAAARNGPLLIIGEPGAGKSGVLNALGRNLGNTGTDVLELAVDRYSVETLEGLSRELGLKHPLLDVLEAWDGPDPAYLVIDALDATRGGRGEGVFRTLIERVLELKGRWIVVASIRNFDLRMGQQFRTLFKGRPPKESLADPSFAGVRHILVPSWSENEFRQLLVQSEALTSCLERAPPRLRDLAMVPFNTRLLCELISGGVVSDLDEVSSQADLLHRYWDHRVGGHDLPAMRSLSRVVELMIRARALRAPIHQVASDDLTKIETLREEGVLVVVDNDRWVQFRHHLLFDYAAAQLALDPDDVVRGIHRFNKADALGLMLSPALGFVLREVWESETDHRRFWIGLGALINDEDGDPVIRSTAGRLGAEFPSTAPDCHFLGDLAISGDEKAQKTLSDVAGALTVRLEDEKNVALEPWVYLAGRLATAPAVVAGPLRFLLHHLIKQVTDDALIPVLGEAARALLAHGLTLSDPGSIVRSAIEFVIDTYGTDAAASRALLRQLFEHGRLDRFGHEEMPTVCDRIEKLGDVDPEFVTDIYRVVFDHEVPENFPTQIGQSQILKLTFSARQDYEMAWWSLGEYLPTFLKLHPLAAVKAVVHAVDGYVARKHPVSDEAVNVELEVGGRLIRLREDRSYVWAHDPDDQNGGDADSLVSKLHAILKSAPEVEAEGLLENLIDEVSYAIFWSRMFLCAAERRDSLVGHLWPIAATEPFLVLPDTRKDAIDVIAAGAGRREMKERQALEQTALTFNFSRFANPPVARQAFLERLFAAIGRANLVTDKARKILDAKPQIETIANERLFAIESQVGTAENLHWIEGLDREAPENRAVIDAINAAKRVLALESSSDEAETPSLGGALRALKAIEVSLVDNSPQVELQRYAEAIIGQGCEVIVSRKLMMSKDAPPTPKQDATFAALLDVAAKSESPGFNADTEAQFERSNSWGSPAARVEAAQAYWGLFVQRPDLYAPLIPQAELMLSDCHPAVRLNAIVRLGHIWDIDRDRMWQLLAEHLAHEDNLSVIEHALGTLVSRLIHADQEQSLELLLELLQREASGSDREHRLNTAVADKFCILWVTYHSQLAKNVLDRWLRTPWEHVKETSTILSTLRGAVVAGVGNDSQKDAALRKRSQALISDIVDAANTRLDDFTETTDPGETEIAAAQACASLIDVACKEMFFAIGSKSDNSALNQAGLNVFLSENNNLLKRIGEYAQPHATYYLLQLVERLVEVNAASAFDLAAGYLQAGRQSDYQNEPMGVKLLVRLIGLFLADHKEIFEDSGRRAALIDCLDIFQEAGWPAARRLFYRLPELIQ